MHVRCGDASLFPLGVVGPIFSLAQREQEATLPELRVSARLDGVFIYNVADEEQQLRGGQTRIFKAFVQSGSNLGYYATKVPHSVRRRGRAGLTSEAAVYFDIESASCVHLALLGDVVPHPAQTEAALLVTEWAEHGSQEQWIRSERQRVAALPRASRLEQPLLAVELAKTLRRMEVAMQMLRGLARLHEGLGRGGGGGEHRHLFCIVCARQVKCEVAGPNPGQVNRGPTSSANTAADGPKQTCSHCATMLIDANIKDHLVRYWDYENGMWRETMRGAKNPPDRAPHFEILSYDEVREHFPQLLVALKKTKETWQQISVQAAFAADAARTSRAIGLLNLGNTCYLNAIMQMLYHQDSLRQTLAQNANALQAASTEGAMARLFNEITSVDGARNAVDPSSFLAALADWAPHARTTQHDARDFFLYLALKCAAKGPLARFLYLEYQSKLACATCGHSWESKAQLDPNLILLPMKRFLSPQAWISYYFIFFFFFFC